MNNTTCKKNPKCPYRKRSKRAYPGTHCEEPNRQYPITCMDCREYPCKGERQSLKTCEKFVWD